MKAKVPNQVTINGHALPPYHSNVVKDALKEFGARMAQRRALGEGQQAEDERQKRQAAAEQINTLFL